MSVSIPVSSQPKKLFHNKNGSGELDVFEAARYFSGATEKDSSDTQKPMNNNMRPFGRMSLDMPNPRGDSIPLQAMLMENRMMNKKEKKPKQPSSPGGKLAYFLNSLFNQTSSKKSKSKLKSTKDEDENSPTSWRRKRRSSMSHFNSGNNNSTIMSDSKSPFSTSSSSGFKTPPLNYHAPHTPINTKSYSYLKPLPTQITKIPITENLNKIETFSFKNDLYDKNMSFHYGFLEKAKIYDEKQEDIKGYKSFIDDDDDEGADSDSSSDLFELTNCDLGYYSSGLPVYETTRVDSINRSAPISS